MNSVEQAVQSVPAGTYIVAVSGGVDSMVLLDALRRRADLELIVAHANHGIRADSQEDAKLVSAFCVSHNIMYEYKELHLGVDASEDAARRARYAFLQHCRIRHGASAIITAHHQDDLVETAIINVLRGTGWRGLAPFTQGAFIKRPLTNMPKAVLMDYAATHDIPWRTDSTNSDQRYLRNYVRLTVCPYLDSRNSDWQQIIMRLVRKNQSLRRTIEAELDKYLTSQLRYQGQEVISRRYIWCMLPEPASYELFQHMCRKITGNSLVRNLAESALIFAKTALPYKTMPLNDEWQLRVTRRELIVEPRLSVVK